MVLDIKSIFTKNFINLTLNQGVNVISTLIYTPILFQTFGDENFGLMHLAFSIVIMLSILTNYGYSLNGPIKIVNSNDNRSQIVNEVLVLAEKDQSIPNPNPLTKVSLVPYQKALIDVQANGAIYQEIVKQLELAKVSHRNKTPLIQIIDKPTLPLENSRLKLFECLVFGIFGGLFFSVLYYSLSRFYKSLIN